MPGCRRRVVEPAVDDEPAGEVRGEQRWTTVEALVMPEQMTAKATRKVTKWMPNALCV